ncbi:MAG: Phosphoserine phosphatase [Syntrophorhabdaceae bacterium PtaU1.Bin034]|nr:MAG: Phosphoserine phosphatase [Syntrophorhabdaceae bacterium PtaU1.Bin034]
MSIRIVFFDCDGTLTPVKSSWQYLHERLGLWDDHADEFQKLFRAGKIDYAEFCRRDAALWKGIPEQRVLDITGEIPYHKGVKETVQAIKDAGITTVILSTGLTFLVDRVRQDLGMTLSMANELVVKEGILTGESKINVEHDNKGYWVGKILENMGLRKEEAVAVGDGEGDQGMFEAVGLAIGYHPAPKIVPFLNHVLYNGSFRKVFEVLRAYR